MFYWGVRMSSIFVPELAVSQAKNKFPAVFETAVTKLNQVKPNTKVEDAISCIANREEEIWTVWANLCKASRV